MGENLILSAHTVAEQVALAHLTDYNESLIFRIYIALIEQSDCPGLQYLNPLLDNLILLIITYNNENKFNADY